MKKYIILLAIIIVLIIFIFNLKAILISKSNNKEQTITYNIIKSDGYNSKYKVRGYYIDALDDRKVLITISSGMKNMGGHGIDIENITIHNKNVKIEVKETEAPDNVKVLSVINYPIIQVELSEMPESLIIKNIDDNTSFKKISD